jgi:hypothetical protein
MHNYNSEEYTNTQMCVNTIYYLNEFSILYVSLSF